MGVAALDLTSPATRRRFFLDRVVRRGSRGAGGDLETLMSLRRGLHDLHDLAMLKEIFGNTPVCLIGAHAAAAYAPERMTRDVDLFTMQSEYRVSCKLLAQAGYRKDADLTFVQTALGLFGSRWFPEFGGPPLDLISTNQSWAEDALRRPPQFATDGDRVMPLPFLVLMKLDAARSVDQGDLSRMLGRLREDQLREVVAIVQRYYGHDPAAVDDVRQYAEVGRWEYEVQSSPSSVEVEHGTDAVAREEKQPKKSQKPRKK